MKRVQDKVALVTGGASGLGRASAELLAAEGASVALTDLQDEAGAAVAAGIAAAGGTAIYLHHDVTSEAGWEEVIAAVLARFGRLDVLVNNAGVGGSGQPLDETPFEEWRRVLSVNLDGVFLGVKHGIRAMKARGGSIINISSILGIVGLPHAGPYAASKGGVRLLTKAAAVECVRKKIPIRVNSIHPGFIDTPMVAAGLRRADGDRLAETIRAAQGEMGEPRDIAEAVLYLASDASRLMTGSELVIDGGMTAQ